MKLQITILTLLLLAETQSDRVSSLCSMLFKKTFDQVFESSAFPVLSRNSPF